MTEVDLRVPTADALLAGVKEGVEEIVRAALEEAPPCASGPTRPLSVMTRSFTK